MWFNDLMRFVFSGFWIWVGFALLLTIVCDSIVKMWVSFCGIFTPVYVEEDTNILDGVTINDDGDEKDKV